jgi:ABC-type transport system involved in multi-copper enzyme maturation permease subunit
MTGVVFMHTLRRNWLTGLYWASGIALLGVYALVVIPNVDMLKQYAQLIQSMPPLLIQAFGVSDASDIATPSGFLGLAFFSYMMLVFAAYGVIAGLNISANEEDRGILDVTLSLPIPRWRLILERFLAYALIIALILLVTFLCMWGVKLTNSGLDIDAGRMAEGIFNMLPSSLLVLAFTLLAGALLRSRGAAAGAAAAFVIVSYFVDFLGNAASGTAAASLRVLSFFSYYNGGKIMSTGLNWGSVGLLLAVTVLCVAGGLWCFQRRDVGV